MELYRNPNFRRVPQNSNATATEVNRSCGDSVSLSIHINSQGILEELGFGGEGCSLSQSSAELVCRLARGLSRQQAGELARSFIRYLASEPDQEPGAELPAEFLYYDELRKYPMRQKCALMAWEILQKLCVAQD